MPNRAGHSSTGNLETTRKKTGASDSADQNHLSSRPSFYVVLIHNDPITPRQFVVEVLQRFFQKPEGEATKILTLARNFGTGVVGKYTHEIAETKAHRVNDYSREAGFPLRFSIEEE